MRHGGADGGINYSVIKIILISLGIAAFLSVVSSTYSIFQSASPDVLNNCVIKPVIFSTADTHISSQDEALEFLKGRADGEYAFVQNTLEACNPPNTGYVYNSINGSVSAADNSADDAANKNDNKAANPANNASYVVCENGVIYRYETTCVKGENTRSLVSMFSKNKTAE